MTEDLKPQRFITSEALEEPRDDHHFLSLGQSGRRGCVCRAIHANSDGPLRDLLRVPLLVAVLPQSVKQPCPLVVSQPIIKPQTKTPAQILKLPSELFFGRISRAVERIPPFDEPLPFFRMRPAKSS
jgi:hypothetical protein